jgi:hypothetical protein
MYIYIFLHVQGIQIFVTRSIERESKLVAERIQALKFIRRVMEIDSCYMPACVVRSIVAIANHKDDNMRRVSLETLRELAIANVAIVCQCNGLKTLMDSILDATCQVCSQRHFRSCIVTYLLCKNDGLLVVTLSRISHVDDFISFVIYIS